MRNKDTVEQLIHDLESRTRILEGQIAQYERRSHAINDTDDKAGVIQRINIKGNEYYIDGDGSAALNQLTLANGTSIDNIVAATAHTDTDDCVWTGANIIDYVGAQITAEKLDFAGDAGTGAVDLNSQTLTVAGTANEIETSAVGQTLTVGLPGVVQIATRAGVGVAANAANALEVNGPVRIGDAGANDYSLEVIKDQDAVTRIVLKNTNNHEDAQATLFMESNVAIGVLGTYSTLNDGNTEFQDKTVLYSTKILALLGIDDEVQIYANGAAAGNRIGTFTATGLGIGVIDPDTKLEVLHAGDQLKLSYDATHYTLFGVSSSSNLNILPDGGNVIITKSHNSSTGISIINSTEGASAVSSLNLQVNSFQGTLGSYDDGWAGERSNKIVLESDITARGVALLALKSDANIDFYVGGVASATDRIGRIDTAGMELNNRNYRGEEINLADDNAGSFTPGKGHGFFMIGCQNTGISAIVTYGETGGTAACKLTAQDSTGAFEVTTGALAGTTGTDGKFTVSFHTDGKIYLENRLGGT